MKLKFAEFKSVDRKGVLLLNRPPLNILTEAMCKELTRFLEDFPVSDFDGLLITSGGKHFSAGADIGEHFPSKVETMLPAFHKLLLTLVTFPLPTTVAIQGACHGGGLELALVCHCIIAWNPEEKLRLSVPEIKLGCFPPSALVILSRFTDQVEDAIRFLLTGQVLKGEKEDHHDTAENMGLIDATFSGTLDELVDSVDFNDLSDFRSIPDIFSEDELPSIDKSTVKKTLASEDMSGISTHALKCAIRVLIECSKMTDFKSALRFAEDVYLSKLVPHPDYIEGLKAFQEKRKPVFEKTGMPRQEGGDIDGG